MIDNSSGDSFSPPRNGWRTFLKLWVVQSLSELGTQVTFFAITIWLAQVLYGRPEQRGELALALAAEGIAFSLAGLVIAPFAGAWADRHDRKRTIILADLASGCVTLLLFGLVLTQSLQLWMWIGLVICLSVSSAFHSSAFQASFVMLLPSEQLPRATGMFHSALAFSAIISPVLAAALIALPVLVGGAGSLSWLSGLGDGTALAVGLDAATYFVAASVVSFLVIPSPRRADLLDEKGKFKRSIGADIKEGALYIWRRPPLMWLLSLFTVANFLLFPSVLIPLLVKFDLSPDWTAMGLTYEAALAVLSTTVGIAGLIWGVIVTTWGGLKKRRVYAVLVPLMMAGLAQVGLGLSPSLYLSAAMVFLLIGMGTVMGTHMVAIWQTQTPRHMQGRVSAVRRVIVQSSAPLGTAIAGWAGGVFDVGMLVAAFGCAIVLYCVVQLFNPQLRRVEDAEYLESLAERSALKADASPEVTQVQ